VQRAVQLELDGAGVDEVELLLLVVQVAPGRVARRQDEGVDAERGDPERAADLAEAGAVAERVEMSDRPSLARHDAPALRHATDPNRLQHEDDDQQDDDNEQQSADADVQAGSFGG